MIPVQKGRPAVRGFFVIGHGAAMTSPSSFQTPNHQFSAADHYHCEADRN